MATPRARKPRDDGEYVTSYLWKKVLRREVLLAILQRFIMCQTETKISLIVNKHGKEKEVSETKGAGRNYLIQHDAADIRHPRNYTTYQISRLEMVEHKFQELRNHAEKRIVEYGIQDDTPVIRDVAAE